MRARGSFALLGAAAAAIALGGCVYRTERTTPAASPPTTVVVQSQPSRTVTYPEGRWELYGDGKTVPYYWVWVPAGTTPAAPPPPPRP